jgi:hypothetical protein
MPPEDANEPSGLDPIIEYYKQFVDREALRENLKLTPTERFLKHQARLAEWEARQAPIKASTFGDPSAESVVDCFKKEVDRTLLRQNLQLTPQERLRKLAAHQRVALENRARAEHRRKLG